MTLEECMNKFKRALMVALTTLLLASWSVPCSANDNALRDLLENALYGGLVGTLVGGALLTFTHKPADHLNYFSVGAGAGVLAGITFSVAKSSRALLALEDGTMKLAMPTIIPELQEADRKGGSTLMLKAELLTGKF